MLWYIKYIFKKLLFKRKLGIPIVAQWKRILMRNREASGLIPGLDQWVKDPVLT